MRHTWVCRLLPAVFVLALAAPGLGQGFGFAWWKDAQFQRDLGLSAEQSAKIDAIFQATISQLRQKKDELDRQEELLSQQIVAGADEMLVTKQVDRVEAIRAHMNKMRTLMLLHERQVLSPDQRVKLSKLHEQWERDHKRPSRGDVK
jgi:Spy/CpxP family protein refolding chaperone